MIKVKSKDIPKSLTLAIIRQESLFNPYAKSSAKARGMMQLLPSTAKRVARQAKLKYSTSRLTHPDYNIALGTRYFKSLLGRFDGSIILSIASYNAGPTNVRRWLKKNGDPREKNQLFQVIDWIESIPFAETRNYVQRVLENQQVYQLMGQSDSITLANNITWGYKALKAASTQKSAKN